MGPLGLRTSPRTDTASHVMVRRTQGCCAARGQPQPETAKVFVIIGGPTPGTPHLPKAASTLAVGGSGGGATAGRISGELAEIVEFRAATFEGATTVGSNGGYVALDTVAVPKLH